MEIYAWVLWLFAALVFTLGELASPGIFFLLTFACGAFGAGLAAFFGASFIMQWLVMFGVTVPLLALMVHRFRCSKQQRGSSKDRFNTEALIGKRAVVTELIDNQRGYVALDGQLWLARCPVTESLKVGMNVEIVSVVGCHVVVRLANHN